MFESAVRERFRAAVDVICPATPNSASASSIGVHDRVMHLIEMSRPGAVPLLAAVLDAYAAQIVAAADFLALDDEQRGKVFLLMADSGLTDIRDGVDALFVFTWATVFTEHHAQGEASTGYHGPSLGVPGYRG